MNKTNTNETPRSERVEGVVQVLILIAVGVMAGAASFTHVHDWTMANSPKGTDDWFGWANAVISELTPIAAGLEARRRARYGQPIGYPIAVLVASVVLSLAAQVAVAKPGITGWLISAVPAIAFMALVKLVISRTPVVADTNEDATTDQPTGQAEPQPVPTQQPATAVIPTSGPTPAPARPAEVEVPSGLVMSANMLAASHHKTTGTHITVDTLADQLGVDHTTAHRLYGMTVGSSETTPARMNGHNPATVAH